MPTMIPTGELCCLEFVASDVGDGTPEVLDGSDADVLDVEDVENDETLDADSGLQFSGAAVILNGFVATVCKSSDWMMILRGLNEGSTSATHNRDLLIVIPITLMGSVLS